MPASLKGKPFFYNFAPRLQPKRPIAGEFYPYHPHRLQYHGRRRLGTNRAWLKTQFISTGQPEDWRSLQPWQPSHRHSLSGRMWNRPVPSYLGPDTDKAWYRTYLESTVRVGFNTRAFLAYMTPDHSAWPGSFDPQIVGFFTGQAWDNNYGLAQYLWGPDFQNPDTRKMDEYVFYTSGWERPEVKLRHDHPDNPTQPQLIVLAAGAWGYDPVRVKASVYATRALMGESLEPGVYMKRTWFNTQRYWPSHPSHPLGIDELVPRTSMLIIKTGMFPADITIRLDGIVGAVADELFPPASSAVRIDQYWVDRYNVRHVRVLFDRNLRDAWPKTVVPFSETIKAHVVEPHSYIDLRAVGIYQVRIRSAKIESKGGRE